MGSVSQLFSAVLGHVKNPLYRNSLYISLSMMVTAAAGFLFWNVAARLYSPSDVGTASAVISAISLVFTISMLGLNFSMIRFYPRYGERVIGSALAATLAASLAVSTAYALLAGRMGSFEGVFSAEFFALFALFSLASTAYNVLAIYAIARRKAEHSFVQSVLFSARFAFLFALVPLGTLGIVSSFGLGLLLGTVYGLASAGWVRPRLDTEFLRESLTFSVSNYVADLANMAPNYLMPTVVLTVLGSEEAAYFYIAFSVANLLMFVPNAVNTSFFVEGSHGLENVWRTLKRATLVSYAYLTAATGFVWFFGGLLLGLFGEEYMAGLKLLKLMMLGSFLVVPVNFSVTILNIRKRVREVALLNVLKAGLFLGLSYALLGQMGIAGIGVAWIGAYGTVLAVIALTGTIRRAA
ncbi:lipopolysaccharide biosynthesis protein [Thermococcus camini]|uniref:Uncharacterized protein n=1 Tax=Thermococcus camini TaxID=2016373 RepID=A0A7G2D8U0_9EURY|nr:lipopolysaccharide biosynthesis protein [Thermococcus camini]CAD5243352.1 conserved membrane protein of unknown function [Thermococcus camini]